MEKERLISKLDPAHPEYESYAAAVRGVMKTGDYQAFGELVGGLIQSEIELEDIVPKVIGEYNWTDVTGKDQRFVAPVKVIGNKAVTMENGMTLATAKFVQNKVYVPVEYITTPAYPIDTLDLKAGDLVTAEMIKNKGSQALIVEKALRMYRLLCSSTRMTSLTATNSRVQAIEDDGTFSDATDMPAYVRTLKRKLEDAVSQLQDTVGGKPNITGFCRQITLDLIKRADIAASIDWQAIPAAEDQDTERPYFTEGDIVLVAPFAANAAEINPVESDEDKPSHYTVSFAFRWAHKWVLWDDKYLRRFVIVDATKTGTLAMDSFSPTEMGLYADVPVDSSTLTTSTVIVSESSGGAHVGATYTVTLNADLRHINIAFGTALTSGTTYYVRTTTSVKNMNADAFAAMDEATVVA